MKSLFRKLLPLKPNPKYNLDKNLTTSLQLFGKDLRNVSFLNDLINYFFFNKYKKYLSATLSLILFFLIK